MIKKCISKDWKFTEYVEVSEFVKGYESHKYENIDLPHDYAIKKDRSPDVKGGRHNGFYPVARGRYIKYLSFDKKAHYIIDFDGAYMNTQVFLNEHYLASHPYGYTPFLVDITDYIIENITNKLVVTTNPFPESSRWYSGNGIYRDVYLWEGGDIRIEPWDMFVSTQSITEKKAKIKLKYTLSADKSADIKICFNVMLKGTDVKKEDLALHVEEGRNDKELIIEIKNPVLWDVDLPQLYTLKTEIFENGTLVDTSFNDFGIRMVEVDAQKGMFLNGKPIKLRGGCIHHDHGVLGTAAYPSAEERKIRLLKNAGFNALRMAHNPPSLAFLECCDRIGMIVMEEAFDVWNKPKIGFDYHLYFEEWCKRDISYMVLRDRNHPCIFSYSIGNEIKELDGTNGAAKYSRLLAETIKKYDDTRFVTSGLERGLTRHDAESCDPDDYKEYIKGKYGHDISDTKTVSSIAQTFEENLDIPGYQYYYKYYRDENKCNPNHAMWGSETCSLPFYDQWKEVVENDFVMGDFCWTAFDNMGEIGWGKGQWRRDFCKAEFPWRYCYQGDFDACGNRRAKSYFRQAVWFENTVPRIFVKHPEHFGEEYVGTDWRWRGVCESWTYDDRYIGRPIEVETYTDAERVEWYINGNKAGESVPLKGIASLVTIYEKGSITAVTYKGNNETGRYTLYTTDEASVIDVLPERTEFKADNRDLCYFNIKVQDREGRVVTSAEHKLNCIVQNGELLGIFSGNPANDDKYTSDTCHAYKGCAVAVVRTNKSGVVKINVYSENLASGYAQVEAK